MQYVTPDDIRTLYITSLSTSDVPLLSLLCTVGSRAMDGYCDRRFYTSTGDETIDFDGPRDRQSRVWHPSFDIASVTSLQLATDSIAASSGTYTTISTGDIYLQPYDREAGWPAAWVELPETESGTYGSSAPFMYFQHGLRTGRFVGKRGWNSTSPESTNFPPEIRMATAELVVKMFRTRESGMANSIGFGDVGTALVERHLSPLTRDLIERYRKGLTR